MKFDHTVKHNGIIYPAGADVPVGGETKKVVEEAPKAEPKKTAKKEK